MASRFGFNKKDSNNDKTSGKKLGQDDVMDVPEPTVDELLIKIQKMEDIIIQKNCTIQKLEQDFKKYVEESNQKFSKLTEIVERFETAHAKKEIANQECVLKSESRTKKNLPDTLENIALDLEKKKMNRHKLSMKLDHLKNLRTGKKFFLWFDQKFYSKELPKQRIFHAFQEMIQTMELTETSVDTISSCRASTLSLDRTNNN